MIVGGGDADTDSDYYVWLASRCVWPQGSDIRFGIRRLSKEGSVYNDNFFGVASSMDIFDDRYGQFRAVYTLYPKGAIIWGDGTSDKPYELGAN